VNEITILDFEGRKKSKIVEIAVLKVVNRRAISLNARCKAVRCAGRKMEKSKNKSTRIQLVIKERKSINKLF